MPRFQLPGYSPLRLGGIASGYAGALFGQGGDRTILGALLRERYGARECLLTDSGTHALQVALELSRSLADGGDRPVALPAYSCFDLVTAAVGAGVPVIFYDVDPITLAPDTESLGRALESRPAAIVAANLFGFPLDWDVLREAADGAGAILIEDAAQGLGSEWRERPGGAQGDLTVLSFGRGKGWTGGGGGALLARSAAAASALAGAGVHHSPPSLTREVRLGMLLAAQYILGRPSLYGMAMAIPGTGLGETTYHAPSPTAGMGRLSAAVVLAHAAAAAAEVGVRRANASLLAERLTRAEAGVSRDGTPGSGIRVCTPLAEGAAAYHRLPVLAPDQETRRRIVASSRRLGVTPGYPIPLPELAAAAALRQPAILPTPGARELAHRLVTLPTHSLTTPSDREQIVSRLEAAMSASG